MLFQQVITSLQMTSCNKPDLTDLMQLDEIDKFIATCWQAGKIDNLQQVCAVFDLVTEN